VVMKALEKRADMRYPTMEEFMRAMSDPVGFVEAHGGVTGFLQAAAICDAYHIDLSGHCAPALHLHAACAVPRLRHLEWFHDHVRIEHLLFDGAPLARNGAIEPDLTRPGNGLIFKEADAARYAV